MTKRAASSRSTATRTSRVRRPRSSFGSALWNARWTNTDAALEADAGHDPAAAAVRRTTSLSSIPATRRCGPRSPRTKRASRSRTFRTHLATTTARQLMLDMPSPTTPAELAKARNTEMRHAARPDRVHGVGGRRQCLIRSSRSPQRNRQGQRVTAYRSPQHKHGGGKFKSERQRRYMWAVVPRAAKRWAHNRGTSKSMWAKRRPARPSITRAPSSRGRRLKR